MANGSAKDSLRQAEAETQNFIDDYFVYWYINHDLWGRAQQFLREDSNNHLHYVKKGQDPYQIAGDAGSWLGKNNKKINKLRVVAHGAPGSFTLGQKVNWETVEPLGGWLYSFFAKETFGAGIELVSCNAAADRMDTVGACNVGQILGTGSDAVGYWLCRKLAAASGQTVDGPLYAQSSAVPLELWWTCRRVNPKGVSSVYDAKGGDPFKRGIC